MKTLWLTNKILLGLLMLSSGIVKLFISGPSGVSGMLSNNFLFSWAPVFWAWILIIGEVGSGIAILSNWKIKYTAIIPAVILSVALLTVTIKWTTFSQSWPGIFFHLIAIVNFLIIREQAKKKVF